MIDTTKAIELIEGAKRIGVLLRPDPSIDEAASAEVLMRTLRARNKVVELLMPPTIFPVDEKHFSCLISSPLLPREFIISVDASRAPISELRYEKRAGGIDIVLLPSSAPVSEHMISFRAGSVRCDILITLGVPSIESVTLPPGTDPAFFTQTPIIAIDRVNPNREYAEANLIDPEKSSCAEVIRHFLSQFPEYRVGKEEANLLLAGICEQTDDFRSPMAGAETLLGASELLRAGGTLPEARAIARKPSAVSLLQLFGRASIRSKTDERGVLWSFITADDFEKTGRSSKDIAAAMKWLAKEFPPAPVHALLWQDPGDAKVHATLGGTPGPLETIRNKRGGTYQSPHLTLAGSYRNFKDAEDDIRSLLENLL